MDDEQQRPPRRPSLAVSQVVGNLASFSPLSDSPTSSVPAAAGIAGDLRFRAPNEHHHQHPSSLGRAGGGAAKVAIPRAPNLSEQSNVNKRVGRACEPCREQKTKCSGDRPTCQRCQDLGLTCLYGDRKRERTAKSLTQHSGFDFKSLMARNLSVANIFVCLTGNSEIFRSRYKNMNNFSVTCNQNLIPKTANSSKTSCLK